MNRTFLMCLVVFALATTRAHAQDSPHPLTLDAKAIADAGIVVDKLAPRALVDTIVAPGEVRVDAYSTLVVTPRVAAQVVERRAKLGEVVAAGAPLVVLSSVDVAETQGRLVVAGQDWARVSALGPQAVSGRRYGEAQVARDQARAALRAYGLTDAQVARVEKRGSAAADGRFELIAPMGGRITTDDFLVGQRVEPGQVLFTVVTEDTVWVEARLPPTAAEGIGKDARVTVMAHGRALPATVIQRSHQTDEKSRTAGVRIRVDNRDDLLHPGELVEARIAGNTRTTQLAVPAEAIVLLQNQPCIFVRGKAAGQFDVAPVEVGETRDGWTPVVRGIAAGTPYVSKGAFALKARLLRSQLGED
ncbi:MAG: efflux RND transporter periplasmic adaptor subunit [Luteibacter sp.]